MIRLLPMLKRKAVLWVKPWVGALTLLAAAMPGCASGGEASAAGRMPRSVVHLDPVIPSGNGDSHVIIVDKSRQRMILYGYAANWKETFQWPCSTGKHAGPKQAEGDGKTPEGIYFATRNVSQPYLSARYGSRALPLDYPNRIDRYRRRGGSAIWIHGTNSSLIANNSNGCVVLQNKDIEQVTKYVDLHRTPIIIVGRLTWWSAQKARLSARKILEVVDQWHTALMHGSYAQFSRWYGCDERPNMRWWTDWCQMRKTRSLGMLRPRGTMRQRAVYKSRDAFVMTFDHYLQAGSQQILVGMRKLYLKLDKGSVRIIGDGYQPLQNRKQDALFMAWEKLRGMLNQQPEIANRNLAPAES